MLRLTTPLRVRARGDFLQTIDPVELVRSICWRLDALATFHGGVPWGDYWPLLERARSISVEQPQLTWVGWERTSTRHEQPRKMTLGGIVGTTILRHTTPDVRAVLLAGSLVHAGKACVVGYGAYALDAVLQS